MEVFLPYTDRGSSSTRCRESSGSELLPAWLLQAPGTRTSTWNASSSQPHIKYLESFAGKERTENTGRKKNLLQVLNLENAPFFTEGPGFIFCRNTARLEDSSQVQNHVGTHDTPTATVHIPEWANTADPMSCIPKHSCGQEPHNTYHTPQRGEGMGASAVCAHRKQIHSSRAPLPLCRQHWAEETQTSSNKRLKMQQL